MKRATATILGGMFLFLAAGVSSAEDEITTIPLSYCEGNDVFKLFWPKKDLDDSGVIEKRLYIYGVKVSITALQKNYGRTKTTQLTFEYENESHKKVYKDQPIGLIIPGMLGDQDKKLPVIFTGVHANNRTKELWATILPNWMMKGEVNKKTVCLVDVNCDGKFDTNGDDYIAIDSRYAIRLKKRISFNGKFYDVEVKPDGSELKLKNVKPRYMGKVKLNDGFKGWEVIALTNDKASYNVAADNCDVIPTGKYHIDYAIHRRAPNIYISLLLGKDFDPELEIRSNRFNIINIGAPFAFYYTATFKNNLVVMKPYLAVAGCSGERYTYHTVPKKTIIWRVKGGIVDGRKNTTTKPFFFASERRSDESGITEHNAVISIKVAWVSITSGYITAHTQLPGFDKLEGKVVFSEGENPKPAKQSVIEYKFPKN